MPSDHLHGLDINNEILVGAVQLVPAGCCADDELGAVVHKDGLSNLAIRISSKTQVPNKVHVKVQYKLTNLLPGIAIKVPSLERDEKLLRAKYCSGGRLVINETHLPSSTSQVVTWLCSQFSMTRYFPRSCLVRAE